MFALAAMAAIGVWTVGQFGFDDGPDTSLRDETATSDKDRSTSDPATKGPQRARANLAAYFSNDDYPYAAIREEAQGQVAFRLTVGRNGRVKRCEVTVSSNHASLDNATCRILRARARFVPARDGKENRIEDQVTGRIRWVLPD